MRDKHDGGLFKVYYSMMSMVGFIFKGLIMIEMLSFTVFLTLSILKAG